MCPFVRPILISLALGACVVLGACASGVTQSGGGADAMRARPPSRPTTPVDPALARVVTQLTSPDFVERTRASETLVSRGAASLPALGAAGDQPVSAPGDMAVSSTRPVVAAILSAADADVVERELDSPWPTVRRAAAEELGRRGRWSPIPNLISGLDDPEADVRSASVESLRRLTNNFFGFRADASDARRSASAARWRTWWHQVGKARADDAPGGPSFAAR